MSDRVAGPIEPIDHKTVDWPRVRHVCYQLEQVFRYDYPGPVEDLRQRLVVFPPPVHGGQRLTHSNLEVSVGPVRLHEELDELGNRISRVYVPRVEDTIEFDVHFLVERHPGSGGVPVEAMRDAAYLRPSALTVPDDRLRAAAAQIAAAGPRLDIAARVCSWVYANVAYHGGVTHVDTTAAQALALGKGVCQDHAHVMIALCRLLDLPARYVSGHLLGEGATHAWVEVLAHDTTGGGMLAVQAFDPSHARRCRPDYITVAVGRDYRDVAPTSGSYTAPYGGALTSFKRASIIQVSYAA